MITVEPYTSEAALTILKEGNRRFTEGRPLQPYLDKEILSSMANAVQRPLAAVLACSDSRVPVELLFNVSFGELFVVRVAGQVAGGDQIASIEYAISYLQVPLVVVMGHTQCGAITAAVQGEKAGGALARLLKQIEPVVRKLKKEQGGASIEEVTEGMIDVTQQELRRQSKVIRDAEGEGKIQIIGALYNMESGEVVFERSDNELR
jgi:carbonic anhydrase